MSTNQGSSKDSMSVHSLCVDQPLRLSTVHDPQRTASGNGVMIPLPLELCHEIYQLLSLQDKLRLGLASKRHLELLEAWKTRKLLGFRKSMDILETGPFSPARAFRYLFRNRGVHMANFTSMFKKNESKKVCLENWLSSDDDWKVCTICLVFLRPTWSDEKKTWRGAGQVILSE
jgi:hypothetical protein